MNEVAVTRPEDPEMTKMLVFAESLLKSKYLPDNIKTPEQAVVIIQKGKELGFKPLQSFEAIDVIMGKSCLKPKWKAALARQTGQVWWKTIKDYEPIYNPDTGDLVDYETVLRGYRKQGDVIVEEDCTYTYSDAALMGLVNKSNWKQQPKVMQYWRCLSRLLDRIAPDLAGGMYMSDEMADVAGLDYTIDDAGNVTIIENK